MEANRRLEENWYQHTMVLFLTMLDLKDLMTLLCARHNYIIVITLHTNMEVGHMRTSGQGYYLNMAKIETKSREI